MSLTSGLSDWLAQQGIWCPEGDGDTLRAAAAAWTAMGEAVTDIGVTLAAAAATLSATTTGSSTTAFGTYWSSWAGDTGYLAVAAAYCASLAAALTGFATDVDVAGAAVLEGIEWAITQSNLTGGVAFSPGVIPTGVPAGVTPQAIAELRTAIDEFAVTLGAAAQSQAASAGVTAIDPSAPPAEPAQPLAMTTTAADVTATPLTGAPDLSTVGVLAPAADLGSLASTALDFGAGQGTVLAPDGAPVALPAPPPTPDTSSPSVDLSAVPGPDPVSTTFPAAATAPPVNHTAEVAAALGAAFGFRKAAKATVSSSALSSGAGLGGGGGSFSTPKLPTIPTSKIPTGAPVTVPPPSAADLAAEKAAENAARATAGKAGGGSMPFMPMGMGGAGAGGGGDDQDEARRRKRRL